MADNRLAQYENENCESWSQTSPSRSDSFATNKIIMYTGKFTRDRKNRPVEQ